MTEGELRLRVIPRAQRNAIVGERGDLLAVKLTAVPVKGAANKALLALLSQRLGVPQGALTIVSGETSREKRLRVEGLSTTEVRRRLLGEE